MADKPWWKNWKVILGIIVVLAAIGALTDEGEESTSEVVPEERADRAAEPEDEPEEEPEGETHDESSLACDHFRNVAGDIEAGILTTEELREKMREIDDNAVIATQRIQQAARAMFAAATQDDGEAFLDAFVEMDEGCTAAGH